MFGLKMGICSFGPRSHEAGEQGPAVRDGIHIIPYTVLIQTDFGLHWQLVVTTRGLPTPIWVRELHFI